MAVTSADLASQQAVIGELLLGARWPDVADIVHSDDYTVEHRLVLSAIAALAADGQPHDPVTVAAQLERAGHLQAAGGLAYLSSIARDTPNAANVRAYATAVRKSVITRGFPEEYRDAEGRARLKRALAELDALETPIGSQHYPIERLDCITAATRVAVVQGLGFDQGTLVALLGTPGAGKTAFEISLGIHVAADAKEWLGLRITGGPVLYVAAEAPGSVKVRARAAAARLAKQGHVAFYITGAVPALGNEEASALDVERTIATIRAVEELEDKPVVLVTIDTLASCLGGGPENGDGMVSLTNAAKAISTASNACVVLVHHPSKGDTSSARGHTSLAAACDSILLVEKESESSGAARTATLIKARDHATGARLRFALTPVVLPERDSFGEALTTVVVEPATGLPVQHKRPAGKNQDTLLTDLERQYRGGKAHFTEAEILQSAKALGMADRNRNAPRNALRDLIRAGFLGGSATSYSLRFPPSEAPP